MAVYKRYKGGRINRSDPHWEGANWWMEFRLRERFFRSRPLREINPMMVRRLKNELLAEKTRPVDVEGERTQRKGSTVNRYLQLLSKIFELAFEEGYVDSNPVRRVPLESEGEGRERYLTYAEEERLLPVLQGRLAHLRCPSSPP